ncbi:hypothetical protein ANN_28001 [Periplaneta americana]|uniref:C2H2-type domain-containing protein n=1 Tax=Periplaneta americana TaxID=6978 RepID=A0ABQ8RUN4_PERAM|nr:hypothetical protein ANN_28001 [Periplaneta americana]
MEHTFVISERSMIPQFSKTISYKGSLPINKKKTDDLKKSHRFLPEKEEMQQVYSMITQENGYHNMILMICEGFAIYTLCSEECTLEEQSDLATVKEEPRVEGTAKDNESFTEWIAANKERCVSSKFDGVAQEENETVCQIPKISDSSEKQPCPHEDKRQLQLEMSKECLSNPAKSTTYLRERVGKNAYKCDIRDRSFSTSCNVKKHDFLNTAEKPFRCNDCGKSFSQLRYLRRHEGRHTGEKAFKCDVCGKSFTESHHLRNHERLHTGEKPFKCDVCGKCFSQSCSLKYHERLHTGEKRFECDVCGKCFFLSSTLKAHERLHTGEKRFKCEICGSVSRSRVI